MAQKFENVRLIGRPLARRRQSCANDGSGIKIGEDLAATGRGVGYAVGSAEIVVEKASRKIAIGTDFLRYLSGNSKG